MAVTGVSVGGPVGVSVSVYRAVAVTRSTRAAAFRKSGAVALLSTTEEVGTLMAGAVRLRAIFDSAHKR